MIKLRVSTRPDCPLCKDEALTGKLWMSERGYYTKCQNPDCKAGVYLRDNLSVEKVVRHYSKDGKAI